MLDGGGWWLIINGTGLLERAGGRAEGRGGCAVVVVLIGMDLRGCLLVQPERVEDVGKLLFWQLA